MIKKTFRIKEVFKSSLLLKSFCFIAILFVLDFCLGTALETLYYKQKNGQLFRTTYSLEKSDARLLIFGSSRANHHYQPDVFEKQLNITAYNVGREANFIFYHYALLTGILKRYTPDVIILDFVRGEFNNTKESYERISSLLPYYRRHKEIRSIVELKSPYERVKLLSRIYPYNSMALTVAMGNLESNKKRSEDIKGYIPLFRTMSELPAVDTIKYRYEIDTVKVNIFKKFVKNCADSGVQLYVVSSPIYGSYVYPDTSLIIAQDILSGYNLSLYDYSGDSLFVNSGKYFWDKGHLNDEGAKLFSEMVAKKILLKKE